MGGDAGGSGLVKGKGELLPRYPRRVAAVHSRNHRTARRSLLHRRQILQLRQRPAPVRCPPPGVGQRCACAVSIRECVGQLRTGGQPPAAAVSEYFVSGKVCLSAATLALFPTLTTPPLGDPSPLTNPPVRGLKGVEEEVARGMPFRLPPTGRDDTIVRSSSGNRWPVHKPSWCTPAEIDWQGPYGRRGVPQRIAAG